MLIHISLLEIPLFCFVKVSNALILINQGNAKRVFQKKIEFNRKYVLTEYVLTELFAIRYFGIKFRQKRQARVNRVYVISRVRTNRVLLYVYLGLKSGVRN